MEPLYDRLCANIAYQKWPRVYYFGIRRRNHLEGLREKITAKRLECIEETEVSLDCKVSSQTAMEGGITRGVADTVYEIPILQRLFYCKIHSLLFDLTHLPV